MSMGGTDGINVNPLYGKTSNYKRAIQFIYGKDFYCCYL